MAGKKIGGYTVPAGQEHKYTEDAEGVHYHSDGKSSGRDPLGKDRPPVRDGAGRPLVSSGSRAGQVDWDKLAEEIEKKGG